MNVIHTPLLHRLISNHVDFVLVGGFAVRHYGCRQYIRDIDLMINPNRLNAQRLIDALAAEGLAAQQHLENLCKPDKKIELPRPYEIDILTPPHEAEYDTFYRDSSIINVNSTIVRVTSLPGIISLKTITVLRMERDFYADKKELLKHKTDLDCLKKISAKL
ncbi:MAG: hypothetical protein ACK4GK_02435 [Ferrovibrio sp.]